MTTYFVPRRNALVWVCTKDRVQLLLSLKLFKNKHNCCINLFWSKNDGFPVLSFPLASLIHKASVSLSVLLKVLWSCDKIETQDLSLFYLHRNEAAILAARKDRDTIEKADLLEAIRRVRFFWLLSGFQTRESRNIHCCSSIQNSLKSYMQMVGMRWGSILDFSAFVLTLFSLCLSASRRFCYWGGGCRGCQWGSSLTYCLQGGCYCLTGVRITKSKSAICEGQPFLMSSYLDLCGLPIKRWWLDMQISMNSILFLEP